MSARSTSKSGFTLVELMIAVVIIGVMAAAVAPSLTEVLADTRQVAAAQDIVQIARRARARSFGSGIAYMLRFRSSASNSLGFIDVFSGMNGKCMQTPWSTAVQAPAGNSEAAKLGAIERFDMADYNPTNGTAPSANDTGRQVITLRASVGNTNTFTDDVCVCYQPNGEAYTMNNANPLAPTFARQSNFIRFQLLRSLGGVQRGQTREVILPMGGNARAR